MDTVDIDWMSSEQGVQHTSGRGLNSSTLCTAADFDVCLSASPGNTSDVRERLSIAGIGAFILKGSRARKAVESKKEMFAEHFGDSSANVGIERSAYEGWEYTLKSGQKDMI